MNHVDTYNGGAISLFARSWAVSPKLLLLIYAVVPICAALVAVDIFVLGGSLREVMPRSPYFWSIWVILFQLPHVTASELTFADREYIKGYWPIIAKALVITGILSIIVPQLFGIQGTFIALAIYTTYHAYMQQYGISLMLLKVRPDFWFNAWKWLSITAAGIFYALVLYPEVFHIRAVPIQVVLHMAQMVGYTLFGLSLLPMAIFAHRAIRTHSLKSTAIYYYFASPILIFVAVVLFSMGYPAFVMIIPRLVHDLTAYSVYVVHDHNRNLGEPKNLVYKLLRPLHISPALLCIPVSMGLAFSIYLFIPFVILINLMSFFHYYIEGHIWKHGALHRQSTPFAPAD